MKRQKPLADFDNITAADLSNDEKLQMLYCEAVRRGFWRNEAGRVLDFFSLAEKALADDKRGTPGKLFYALIKQKNVRYITDAMEERARRRLAGRGYDLVEQAADLTLAARPVSHEAQEALLGRDIGYFHGVMMQCFLPQKKQPLQERKWTVKHGKAALAVQAGIIADREHVGEFIDCALPSGAKARLIIPYIIGYAVQRNTRQIDMGTSLRRFMEQIKVPITGPNGKALTREVQNVASARFVIGGWDDKGVTTRMANIAEELTFWIDKQPNQCSFWRPEMILDPKFFEAISERRVPVDMNHLVRLQRSPRRMDLYCWLSYRTPTIGHGETVKIKLCDLQPIFAPDIADPYNFKNRLKNDLKGIATIYRDFNVAIEGDMLTLRKSFSPVPANVTQLVC
ncbi:MAG: replication protein RepA [Pseudomonadota bacterium]